MNVAELLQNLTNYVTQSPENQLAQVVVMGQDGLCYGLTRGDDAKGIPGEHFLILKGDFNGQRFGTRVMSV